MADELTNQESLQPTRPSLLGILFSVESGGKNIANTTQGTTSGQAQGFFQITTGTWNEFAPSTGVDTSVYPTPMSAPYAVQARVASAIPLSRWDPKTIAAIRTHYPGINTSATLGQNVAATGGNFVTNAPGNAGDSRFRISRPTYASFTSGYSGLTPNTLMTAPPKSPLESTADVFGNAVADTAEKKAAPEAAAPAGARPGSGPPIGQAAPTPFGLQPGQRNQPTPQPVPRTMDYYLALLKRQATPEAANG